MNRRAFVTALSVAPLAMAQGGVPELAGSWKATLAAGGASLRLTLDVTKSPDGVYLGSLTSLDQGNAKIPIDSIKLTGNAVHLELKAVGGTFEGTLDATSAKLTGTWTQAAPLPLEFTRTSAATAATAAAAKAPATPASYPLGLPLDITVPSPPVPFPGKGKLHLAYELHITNCGPELTLERLEILDGFGNFEGAALNNLLKRIGNGTGEDRRILETGRRVIAFLWINLPEGASAPATLRHRITAAGQTLDLPAIPVSTVKPVSLGIPFRGKQWVAANGPANSSPHRRAAIPIDGRLAIAQRFAIDWVRAGDNEKTHDGDPKDNKVYFAYGTEVLAVADATVSSTKDGIPQNIPGENSRAVPITKETIGGNYVVLDLGGSQYAFYGHLQPGSLKVKTGDRVKKGQTLGLLGNSGNSTEPHLHFHVSNGPNPLAAEGIPYVFEKWHNELPLQNEVVSFD